MFENENLKIHEGKLYGLYRAKVVNNKDKNYLGRIKVECPSVYGEGIESPWCYASSVLAGKSCGIFCVPSEGDFVWLLFEKGSPDYPVYLGSPFTPVKGQPNELRKTKAGKDRTIPNVYGIRTPSGNTIVIDEDVATNANEIRITHKSGSSIVMQSDGSIKINPASGKGVTVNGPLTASSVSAGSVTASGVSLTSHVHGGVMGGGGNTTGPT